VITPTIDPMKGRMTKLAIDEMRETIASVLVFAGAP
jgi:hypothetical protein